MPVSRRDEMRWLKIAAVIVCASFPGQSPGVLADQNDRTPVALSTVDEVFAAFVDLCVFVVHYVSVVRKTSVSSNGTAVSNWSNVQARGGLSVRQRWKVEA